MFIIMMEMKVKGTEIISLKMFVESRFGEDGFAKWLAALDEETQYVVQFAMASSWYPAEQMFAVPGRRMCELFFPDDLEEGAREWGRAGADRELTGVYRLLVRVGSTNMMLSTAADKWPMFYNTATLRPVVNEKHHALLRLEGSPVSDILWANAVAGWLERALAMSGVRDARVDITQTTEGGLSVFEFNLTWR